MILFEVLSHRKKIINLILHILYFLYISPWVWKGPKDVNIYLYKGNSNKQVQFGLGGI